MGNGSLGSAMSTEPDSETSAPERPSPWAMWWALGGMVIVLVLMVVAGARVGGIILAIHLTLLGIVRLVAPSPGPFGIAARSRLFDIGFYWLGAFGIALMSLTADNL